MLNSGSATEDKTIFLSEIKHLEEKYHQVIRLTRSEKLLIKNKN
jgi:hypothetical protein